jgi:hypothetical protein
MWISNHTVTFTGNGYRRSLRKSNPHSFVIPKPGLSARNLLGTSSEAADSSRGNAALRNDNSLGMFKLHDYAATVLQANSSFVSPGRWPICARRLTQGWRPGLFLPPLGC